MVYIILTLLLIKDKDLLWNYIKTIYKITKIFLQNYFLFLLYNSETNEFIKRQDLVQYFYLPINEIFFFVFGTSLLSIGYKWKIRIDNVILFLLVSIYLAKIISYFNLYKKNLLK